MFFSITHNFVLQQIKREMSVVPAIREHLVALRGELDSGLLPLSVYEELCKTILEVGTTSFLSEPTATPSIIGSNFMFLSRIELIIFHCFQLEKTPAL